MKAHELFKEFIQEHDSLNKKMYRLREILEAELDKYFNGELEGRVQYTLYLSPGKVELEITGLNEDIRLTGYDLEVLNKIVTGSATNKYLIYNDDDPNCLMVVW